MYLTSSEQLSTEESTNLKAPTADWLISWLIGWLIASLTFSKILTENIRGYYYRRGIYYRTIQQIIITLNYDESDFLIVSKIPSQIWALNNQTNKAQVWTWSSTVSIGFTDWLHGV